MKFPRIVLTAVLLAVVACFPLPAAAQGPCTTSRLAVTALPGQQVSVTLCVPPDGADAVDVLVHGGTYNGSYWHWPVGEGRYSYALRAVASGRAALFYDRPGTGASTRPPSTALTVAAEADLLHQLIADLRGRGYASVTVVGHSLGSMIVINEASRYRDADRLVLTGMLHPPAIGSGTLQVYGSFYPALLDPAFRIPDIGYLTTRPGTRGGSFYDAGTADPAVIVYDEAHRDVMSATQLADGLLRTGLPPAHNESRHVTADILFVVGRKDITACGPIVPCDDPGRLRANEAPYFPAAASLTADSIPATGHNLTLHPSAGSSYDLIDAWIRSHPAGGAG